MAFEHNNLSGSLFDNERKERDNQPDMTGSCKINGEEFWVSAWIKEGNKGSYLSLAFTEKEAQGQSRPSKSNTGSFLGKKRKGVADAKKLANDKYKKEMEEFEKLTQGQDLDEFDDDIPF